MTSREKCWSAKHVCLGGKKTTTYTGMPTKESGVTWSMTYHIVSTFVQNSDWSENRGF